MALGIVFLRATTSLSGEPIRVGDEYCPAQARHTQRRFRQLAQNGLVGVGEVLRTKKELAEFWVVPEPDPVEEEPADGPEEETASEEDEADASEEDEGGDAEQSDEEAETTEQEAKDDGEQSPYTLEQINDMKTDDLRAVVETEELDVDFSGLSLPKKRKAVAAALGLA